MNLSTDPALTPALNPSLNLAVNLAVNAAADPTVTAAVHHGMTGSENGAVNCQAVRELLLHASAMTCNSMQSIAPAL